MLKDLIDVIEEDRAKSLSLTERLDSYIDTITDDEFFADGWHPSTLCDFCPRKKILEEEKGVTKEKIPPRIRRLFDAGHDTHSRYQNTYLGPMGILWGLWECSRCKKRVWGFFPTKWCDCRFRRKGWKYKEVPVECMEEGIDEPYKGRSDGVLYLCNTWFVLDIKTSKHEAYTFLKKPYKKHTNQLDIYGKLIRDGFIKSPFKNSLPVEKRVVLYYNKNDSEHKAFVGDLDFDNGRYLMDLAKEYTKAQKEKYVPKRLPDCRIKSAYRASKCSMKDECFRK